MGSRNIELSNLKEISLQIPPFSCSQWEKYKEESVPPKPRKKKGKKASKTKAAASADPPEDPHVVPPGALPCPALSSSTGVIHTKIVSNVRDSVLLDKIDLRKMKNLSKKLTIEDELANMYIKIAMEESKKTEKNFIQSNLVERLVEEKNLSYLHLEQYPDMFLVSIQNPDDDESSDIKVQLQKDSEQYAEFWRSVDKEEIPLELFSFFENYHDVFVYNIRVILKHEKYTAYSVEPYLSTFAVLKPSVFVTSILLNDIVDQTNKARKGCPGGTELHFEMSAFLEEFKNGISLEDKDKTKQSNKKQKKLIKKSEEQNNEKHLNKTLNVSEAESNFYYIMSGPMYLEADETSLMDVIDHFSSYKMSFERKSISSESRTHFNPEVQQDSTSLDTCLKTSFKYITLLSHETELNELLGLKGPPSFTFTNIRKDLQSYLILRKIIKSPIVVSKKSKMELIDIYFFPTKREVKEGNGERSKEVDVLCNLLVFKKNGLYYIYLSEKKENKKEFSIEDFPLLDTKIHDGNFIGGILPFDEKICDKNFIKDILPNSIMNVSCIGSKERLDMFIVNFAEMISKQFSKYQMIDHQSKLEKDAENNGIIIEREAFFDVGRNLVPHCSKRETVCIKCLYTNEEHDYCESCNSAINFNSGALLGAVAFEATATKDSADTAAEAATAAVAACAAAEAATAADADAVEAAAAKAAAATSASKAVTSAAEAALTIAKAVAAIAEDAAASAAAAETASGAAEAAIVFAAASVDDKSYNDANFDVNYVDRERDRAPIVSVDNLSIVDMEVIPPDRTSTENFASFVDPSSDKKVDSSNVTSDEIASCCDMEVESSNVLPVHHTSSKIEDRSANVLPYDDIQSCCDMEVESSNVLPVYHTSSEIEDRLANVLPYDDILSCSDMEVESSNVLPVLHTSSETEDRSANVLPYDDILSCCEVEVESSNVSPIYHIPSNSNIDYRSFYSQPRKTSVFNIDISSKREVESTDASFAEVENKLSNVATTEYALSTDACIPSNSDVQAVSFHVPTSEYTVSTDVCIPSNSEIDDKSLNIVLSNKSMSFIDLTSEMEVDSTSVAVSDHILSNSEVENNQSIVPTTAESAVPAPDYILSSDDSVSRDFIMSMDVPACEIEDYLENPSKPNNGSSTSFAEQFSYEQDAVSHAAQYSLPSNSQDFMAIPIQAGNGSATNSGEQISDVQDGHEILSVPTKIVLNIPPQAAIGSATNSGEQILNVQVLQDILNHQKEILLAIPTLDGDRSSANFGKQFAYQQNVTRSVEDGQSAVRYAKRYVFTPTDPEILKFFIYPNSSPSINSAEHFSHAQDASHSVKHGQPDVSDAINDPLPPENQEPLKIPIHPSNGTSINCGEKISYEHDVLQALHDGQSDVSHPIQDISPPASPVSLEIPANHNPELVSPSSEVRHSRKSKPSEPFISVSSVVESESVKTVFEAHEFESDASISEIHLTKKDTEETKTEIYPCLKKEFKFKSKEINEHMARFHLDFQFQQDEMDSLNEHLKFVCDIFKPRSVRKGSTMCDLQT